MSAGIGKHVIFEFLNCPLDGTIEADIDKEDGDRISVEEATALSFDAQTSKGQVGKRFIHFSAGRAAREIVVRGGEKMMPAYVYEVTDRMEDEAVIYCRSNYVAHANTGVIVIDQDT